MRRLPPLTALRDLEAAARLGSFKKAAEELGVSPTSVSQQIKSLEGILGVELFVRQVRGISLTEAARAALPSLTDGFDLLAEACRIMGRKTESGPLTVSCVESLGTRWIIPRLGSFQQMYPDIPVRLLATATLADFRTDGVDVAIRYGTGDYPGLHKELMAHEVFYPVCSPDFLVRHPELKEPKDLSKVTILHDEWWDGRLDPGWGEWLASVGAECVNFADGPGYSQWGMTVDGAIAGQGVALGKNLVAREYLDRGLLVRPFPQTVVSERSYWFVCPKERLREKKVRVFRDWLFSQVAEVCAQEL